MTRLLCSCLLLVTGALGCATTRAVPDDRPVAAAAEPAPTAGAQVAEEVRADPLAAPPDVAAPPPEAQRTSTGLASKVLRAGSGTVHPGTFSVVRVDYTGWTVAGQLFDSSVQRGKPAEFPLSGVISGWRQGVKMMVVGEKRRFWIPEELAYKGASGPQGTLVFDVELLAIVQP